MDRIVLLYHQREITLRIRHRSPLFVRDHDIGKGYRGKGIAPDHYTGELDEIPFFSLLLLS